MRTGILLVLCAVAFCGAIAFADGPTRGRISQGGGSVSDGGPPTEPFVAIAPLSLYDDGGSVAVSSSAAGAGVSGYLTNVGGILVVDAGVVAIGGGYLGGDSHFGGYLPVLTLGDVTFAQTRLTAPATFTRLSYEATAAGTVGGTFTIDVYDNTTTTVLCVSSAQSCTSTGFGLACSTGGASADDIYLRAHTTGCSGTGPSGNIAAEYR